MEKSDSVARFMDVHLQTWERKIEKPEHVEPGPVIAITRDPGCDGESIAQKIAEEFDLVLFDGKIVEEIAMDAHVSEQVVATLDKSFRSELDDWLAGFAGGPTLSTFQYMQSLRRVLFSVAAHGSAVILGRGANFLLPPEKKTLGIRLVAPLEVRVIKTMQALGLSQEDAQTHLTRMEHEQQTWVRKHCNADTKDATHYHLVINTALVRLETIIQMVKVVLTK
jgi:cytidylate kinase